MKPKAGMLNRKASDPKNKPDEILSARVHVKSRYFSYFSFHIVLNSL